MLLRGGHQGKSPAEKIKVFINFFYDTSDRFKLMALDLFKDHSDFLVLGWVNN